MSATVKRKVILFPDAQGLARRAAEEFINTANNAVATCGSFTVALAGGSTPKLLYTLLVEDAGLRSQVPWDKMQVFFGDERHAGPADKDSNYRMANESLISKSPLKPEQISRIKGEYDDTEKAALEYERVLRAYFKLKDGELPRFDLVLLGMGDEGHTLSLFPGTKALNPSPNRFVVRNWVGKLYTERITLTAAAASQANQVIFMVTRADKALALKAVLEGPYEPEQLPSQLIQPSTGNLLWLVDQDAGSLLSAEIVTK
ncbi:MAG: 6-phosphogluconolactonase [Candidatus Acidiferrum sp.]